MILLDQVTISLMHLRRSNSHSELYLYFTYERVRKTILHCADKAFVRILNVFDDIH